MDILIIGGIAGGMSAAAKAIRTYKNFNITVIEKEEYISFGACGLPYYLGNKFNDSNKMFVRTPEQMEDEGINLLLKHEALLIDYKNKNVTIKNLKTNKVFEKSYDRLIIATGATPFVPNLPGINGNNVYTFTKLDTVEKIKKNLDKYNKFTIIGGGFIGIEVADQLLKIGKKVNIIHSSDYIMNSTFDTEFSEKMASSLIEEGVLLSTGQRAEEFIIDEFNNVTKVKTNISEYETDAVIIAVGFKPNTAFTGKEIEKLKNGAIIVDKFGRTNIKDVFAVGDCASVEHRLIGQSYIPLATTASKLGRIIGINIGLEEENMIEYPGSLGSSTILVGKYEGAVTGLTEQQAIKNGFDYNTTLIEAISRSGYFKENDKIMIKLVYDKKTYVIYGAQLLGESGAALRATAFNVAIHNKMTTKELGYVDIAYSPPFSVVWDPINIAGNTGK